MAPMRHHIRTELRNTPDRGMGVFALEAAPRGTLLFEEPPALHCDLLNLPLLRMVGPWMSWFSTAHVDKEILSLARGASRARDRRWLQCLVPCLSFAILVWMVFSLIPAIICLVASSIWLLLRGKVIYDVFFANAFDTGSAQTHAALYLYASRANHSCQPNTFRTIEDEGFILRLYAARDIVAGNELTISYLDERILCSKDDRRRELQEQQDFLCKCTACEKTDPASDERRCEMGAIFQEMQQQQWSKYSSLEALCRCLERFRFFILWEDLFLPETELSLYRIAVMVSHAGGHQDLGRLWGARFIDALCDRFGLSEYAEVDQNERVRMNAKFARQTADFFAEFLVKNPELQHRGPDVRRTFRITETVQARGHNVIQYEG